MFVAPLFVEIGAPTADVVPRMSIYFREESVQVQLPTLVRAVWRKSVVGGGSWVIPSCTPAADMPTQQGRSARCGSRVCHPPTRAAADRSGAAVRRKSAECAGQAGPVSRDIGQICGARAAHRRRCGTSGSSPPQAAAASTSRGSAPPAASSPTRSSWGWARSPRPRWPRRPRRRPTSAATPGTRPGRRAAATTSSPRRRRSRTSTSRPRPGGPRVIGILDLGGRSSAHGEFRRSDGMRRQYGLRRSDELRRLGGDPSGSGGDLERSAAIP